MGTRTTTPADRRPLAVTESVGAQFLGYLVWAWHWADPRHTDLPWADCRRFDFDRRTAARKRWATGAFALADASAGARS